MSKYKKETNHKMQTKVYYDEFYIGTFDSERNADTFINADKLIDKNKALITEVEEKVIELGDRDHHIDLLQKDVKELKAEVEELKLQVKSKQNAIEFQNGMLETYRDTVVKLHAEEKELNDEYGSELGGDS